MLFMRDRFEVAQGQGTSLARAFDSFPSVPA
jgi:hypothetical protein